VKAISDKQKAKTVKEYKDLARFDIKRLKEKNITHGDYEGMLQTEINTIVRLIDKGHVCMSHGKHGKKINAGHYHSIGSNNSLRFNLENIWLQCESCNGYKGSNRSGYDKGLVETYGQTYFLRINQDIVREYPLVKMSIPELKEKIVIAREIVKELKAADNIFSTDERIEYRKFYNKQIGIYNL